MDCLQNEITQLKEYDLVKYCVLLLVLFKENKLTSSDPRHINLLTNTNDRHIFGGVGDPVLFPSGKLERALKSLNKVYISNNSDRTYSFSHDPIFDLFRCIMDSPESSIQQMDLKYVNVFSMQPNFKDEIKDSMVTNALIKRLTREIEMGNVLDVSVNYAWCFYSFTQKWIGHIKDTSSEHLLLTQDCTDDWKISYTLLEGLMLLEKAEAVGVISQDGTVVDCFKRTDEGKNILSSVLELAEYCSNCSGRKNIIKTIQAVLHTKRIPNRCVWCNVKTKGRKGLNVTGVTCVRLYSCTEFSYLI